MSAKTRAIRIGNRTIGSGRCFIIAEAGSNHNGSLDKALALIDVAADAGCDAVKFQLFTADKLYPRSAGQSDYLGVEKPIYEIIEEMELPVEWLETLAEHSRHRDLVFFAAPFDEQAADLLEAHVDLYKIASYEMTHLPLLRHVARKGKPVIMSTGTANLAEVSASVAAFRETGNEDLILMQCTAKYPAPLDSLNVRAMVTLKERFSLPTGLSDHSRDPVAGPVTAAALGADVLEKHITLSNRLPGPDHAFAVEPGELAKLVRRVRQVEAAAGTGVKEVLPDEEELRSFSRRALFSTRSIAEGETFTPDNIAALRTGKLRRGLGPEHYEQVLGRRAARRLPPETPITEDDLE